MVEVVGLVLSVLWAAPSWEHYELTTETEVWDVVSADLNGDGVDDLMAYCSDPNSDAPQKHIAVFMGQPDGSYPAVPSLTLPLPATNGAAFIAEFDGEPPVEFVAADQSAAQVYRLMDGAFRPIQEVKFDSLFPTSSREPLFLRDVAHDVDGDGIDEWLIPVPSGYAIFRKGTQVASVPAPIESETRLYSTNYMVVHRLPAVRAFDVAGQEQQGLAFLNETHADFSYGADWKQHRRYHIPQRLEEDWDSSTDLRDINGDGIPDLLVQQTSGTVNLEVLTQIYLARGLFEYPDTPDDEFRTKGSFTTSALRDVNGDGRLDLIFLNVPLGFKNILNYFFRNKVEVKVDVHLFEDGNFSKRASMSTGITVEAPEGRERVAYSMGDFAGDGKVDAAIGVSADKLAFYRSDKEDFLASRPWLTIKMPTFGVARSGDLNGDGKDDLVLFHPSGEYQKRIDVIVF